MQVGTNGCDIEIAVIGNSRGMIKFVAEEPAGAVLGVHICAPLAAEMIQEAVFAVNIT